MDVYEAISARKTIRDFADREIEPELIKKLIAAGFNAPSNNHMREWHFVVLQDRARRKALLDAAIKPTGRRGAVGIVNRWGLTDEKQRECYIEAIPRQYKMLFTPGVLIFPCWNHPGNLLKPRTLSDLNPFASIWCVVENILVAAASEGIFGVTRIPFEPERVLLKEFLCLPAGYEIPCYLALGYPAETAARIPQVDIDLSERIHLDHWM